MQGKKKRTKRETETKREETEREGQKKHKDTHTHTHKDRKRETGRQGQTDRDSHMGRRDPRWIEISEEAKGGHPEPRRRQAWGLGRENMALPGPPETQPVPHVSWEVSAEQTPGKE